MIELIKADQYTKMLWKNGAGYTLNLLEVKVTADFDWRISMADVKTSGDFPNFPISSALLRTRWSGHGIACR
jgi:environmental stress-induced protein Ves